MPKSFEESYATGQYKSQRKPKHQTKKSKYFDGQKMNSLTNKPQASQVPSNMIAYLLRFSNEFQFYLLCTPLTTLSSTLQILGKSKESTFESTNSSKLSRLSRLPADLPLQLNRRYMNLFEVVNAFLLI